MNTQEEEYVTLFCEGDGGVGLNDRGYPRVCFYQKERAVLDYINSLTENGRLHQNKGGHWRLEFHGSHCIPLLEIFTRHVVGKCFLERLNVVLGHVDMPLAAQHPLTLDGFVAFWDAEGSSSNAPTIFVSQKDREILDLIVVTFGGNVSFDNRNKVHSYHLSGDEACTLTKVILEKSHNPSRAECLRRNFEGPNYYELHKDERRTYREKKKAIWNWIKAHPNEVAKLKGATQ